TRCLSLHRTRRGSVFQAYKGYLLPKPDGPADQFTLAGTFVDVIPGGGGPAGEYGWGAGLPKAAAPAKARNPPAPTLAEDFRAMQGEWVSTGSLTTLARTLLLPDGATLNTRGVPVTVRGNTLLRGDKVLATIANDLPLADKQAEIT